MSEFNKYSTDGGATFIDVEDSNAVHWADNGVLGAKNLLQNKVTARSQHGVTLTKDSDGVITLNGTVDTNDFFNFMVQGAVLGWDINLVGKTYIASYGDTTNNSHVMMQMYKLDGTSQITVSGNNDSLPITVTSEGLVTANASINIQIKANSKDVVFDNLKLYPMFRLSTDTDKTFVPYTMTNRELTEALYYPKQGTFNVKTGTEVVNNISVYGNLVVADLRVDSVTLSAWNDLAITYYVPPYATRIVGVDASGNLVTFSLNTNGHLQPQNSISGNNIYIHAVWALK